MTLSGKKLLNYYKGILRTQCLEPEKGTKNESAKSTHDVKNYFNTDIYNCINDRTLVCFRRIVYSRFRD